MSESSSSPGELVCQTCRLARCKKAWRPCQWAQWSAGTRFCPPVNGYTQCKVCDAEIDDRRDNGWLPASTPKTTSATEELPLPRGNVEEAVLNLRSVMCRLRELPTDEFIQRWMTLPRQTRKDLSYDGALRCQPGDPVHYMCPRTRETSRSGMWKPREISLKVF